VAGAFRPARLADLDALLRLQRDYYAEDAYPFEAEAARAVWARLIADPSLGRTWVADESGDVVAYAVLTMGYSLEYRGRDAFVDELYVAPKARARGLGRAALAVLEEACAGLGVTALHLEVERGKDPAEGLYRRSGFVAHTRVLMTKRIARGGGAG
jgi:GNAT superfamily N-acetyltransferase